MSGVDEYGRSHGENRAMDYEYANFGNKNAPPAEPPVNNVSKILLAAGMKREDALETGPAIVKLMEKMGPEAPQQEQMRMVRNFMTMDTRRDDVIAAVTEAALGEMKWNKGGPAVAAPAAHASAPAGPKVKP